MNKKQKEQLKKAINLIYLIDEDFSEKINTGKATKAEKIESNKIYQCFNALKEFAVGLLGISAGPSAQIADHILQVLFGEDYFENTMNAVSKSNDSYHSRQEWLKNPPKDAPTRTEINREGTDVYIYDKNTGEWYFWYRYAE